MFALQTQGQRYVIEPQSAVTPLYGNIGVIYAPIVLRNANETLQATNETYLGNTLLTVTAGDPGGLIAERAVPLLFNQSEM